MNQLEKDFLALKEKNDKLTKQLEEKDEMLKMFVFAVITNCVNDLPQKIKNAALVRSLRRYADKEKQKELTPDELSDFVDEFIDEYHEETVE
jgi:hypothetical protein